MKKVLSVMMSVLVAIVAINSSIVAFAKEEILAEKGNYLITYNEASKQLIVAGRGALYDNEGDFPSDLFIDKNDKVESVVIQEGITVICRYDFEDFANLKEITLPRSLVRINPHSFRNCNKISKINYAGSQEDWNDVAISKHDNGGLSGAKISFNVSVAESGDFEEEYGKINGRYGTEYDFRTAVLKVDYKGAVNAEFLYTDSFAISSDGGNDFCVTGLDIADGATILGKDMMAGCYDLEYVNIPKSVKYIRKGCFSDCDSLKKIYFEGSKAEWKKIRIEKTGNEDLLDANVHFAVEEEYSNAPVYAGIGVVLVLAVGIVLVVTRKRN